MKLLALASLTFAAFCAPSVKAYDEERCRTEGNGQKIVTPLCQSNHLSFPIREVKCGSFRSSDTGVFDGCCPHQDTTPSSNPCHEDPGAGNRCRDLNLIGARCDMVNNEQECLELQEEPAHQFSVDIKFSAHTEAKCCATCRCFGDPFCLSFNNVEKQWIPCDARDPENTRRTCKITRRKCRSMKDHNNQRCKWLPARSNGFWPTWLEGGPCQPADLVNNPPVMTMYEADGFSLVLTLGERGIIQAADIKMTENYGGVNPVVKNYRLDSDDCFLYDIRNDTLSAEEIRKGAWQSGDNEIPSNWYPTAERNVDIVWYVIDPSTGIDISLTCTRIVQEFQGVMTNGRARLAVENREPTKDWKTTRSNPEGFCATDVIDERSGDNENTDDIFEGNLCFEAGKTDHAAAKSLCSRSITLNKIPQCKERYCRGCEGGLDALQSDVNQCLADIENESWEVVFCRYQLGRDNVDDVNMCVTDIRTLGNGWKDAVQRFGNCGNVVTAPDICPADLQLLNSTLLECQQGITMSYNKGTTVSPNWVPYKAFPQIDDCDFSFNFNAKDHPEVFFNEVRFTQCDLNRESCSAKTCDSIHGVSIDYEYAQAGDNILDLWENGILVCAENDDYLPPHPEAKTWCIKDMDNNKIDELCRCDNECTPLAPLIEYQKSSSKGL